MDNESQKLIHRVLLSMGCTGRHLDYYLLHLYDKGILTEDDMVSMQEFYYE